MRIQCFDGDVRRYIEFADFVQGHDTIIHLAGVNDLTDVDNLMDVNVVGTLNGIKACLHHKARLFVAGTNSEFGAYGFSKSICESMMIRSRLLGLTGAYMAIPEVFGPRSKPYGSVASSILHSIAKNVSHSQQINPQSELMLMYIHDVCETIETFISLDQIVFDEEYVHEQPNRIDFYAYGGFKIKVEDLIAVAQGRISRGARIDNMIKQTVQWYKNNNV